MRAPVIRDRWTLRLAALCTALGFLLLINSLWQPEAHLPGIEAVSDGEKNAATEATEENGTDTEGGAAPAAQAPVRRSVKPLSAYAVTLKRPLFRAIRRQAPPETFAQPKKPPEPKAPPRSNLNGIRLTGVIRTAEKAFGLLSLPGQSELMRTPVGTVVKGWKVTDVEEAAIVLNNGEEEFRMALWKEESGPGNQGRTPHSPRRKPGTVAGGQ